MAKSGDQMVNQQVPRQRFPVLGPENGEAFIELLTAMQDLESTLGSLHYPFRKVSAIWSLEAQEKYEGASWRDLPTVFFQHAFNLATNIRMRNSDLAWERTGLPEKRLPRTNEGRWVRISDGTIRTIDLGQRDHCMGLFDAQGNQIGRFEREKVKDIIDNPSGFAKRLFNSCDVLVMEDFRKKVSDPQILSTRETKWLEYIRCDVLYRCLASEARETRRRLILCKHDWTSWTCPHCLNIHKGHDRFSRLQQWGCPKCSRPVERDSGSCLELLRRYLTGTAITYDIARHGPAGFALRR